MFEYCLTFKAKLKYPYSFTKLPPISPPILNSYYWCPPLHGNHTLSCMFSWIHVFSFPHPTEESFEEGIPWCTFPSHTRCFSQVVQTHRQESGLEPDGLRLNQAHLLVISQFPSLGNENDKNTYAHVWRKD